MHLTPQDQAVLLLTVSFGKLDREDARPLSNGEWARFAFWLKDHGLEPAILLKGDLPSVLSGWMDRSVSFARLEALLGRGAALGLALEKWQRAGLWILTRSDPDYPGRLKQRLRFESPAVLFGCGNKSLLSRGGIAVVGSRDAAENDLVFAGELGKAAAAQGYSIVSGGARGVDQSAMLGALEGDGTAMGVLADSLLRSVTSAKYRKRIMSGDLVLVTPFNPEAGFNVGHAMARNRYVYCLADAAVVVSSTQDKGGTWNGALEDLKAAWVPLWVKRNASAKSGNAELVRLGARWLPDDPSPIAALLRSSAVPETSPDALLPVYDPEHETGLLGEPSAPELLAASEVSDRDAVHSYASFLTRLGDITAAAPMTADDMRTRLALKRTQLSAWLKQGISEGKIRKLKKPIRYQAAAASKQASLFGDKG